MIERDAEVNGDVQNRLRLPVFVVRELAGFELHGLVEIRERNLGHIPHCNWHTEDFMFHLLEKRIAEAFGARIAALYQVTSPVQTEQPKQSSFGEIALPAAFQLARQLKKAPKAIAQELSDAVGKIEGVAALKSPGTDI